MKVNVMVGVWFVHETQRVCINYEGTSYEILMELFKRIIKVIESSEVISNASSTGYVYRVLSSLN